jgi:DivIVA domain-containing protein
MSQSQGLDRRVAGGAAMRKEPLTPEHVRARRFNRVVRGYRRRQVDRLLDRVAADLARKQDGPLPQPDDPAPLTPGDIEQVRFSAALGGYEMAQVDDFLDEVVGELDRLAREPPQPRPAPQPAPALPPPPPPLSAGDVERRTFSPGEPGYLVTEVDRFLARAASSLAHLEAAITPGAGPPERWTEPEPPLTRWDVLRQRFPLGPRGYARYEVDAFLVQLAAQFPEPGPVAEEELLRRLRLDR